jgi:hypothetical protein
MSCQGNALPLIELQRKANEKSLMHKQITNASALMTSEFRKQYFMLDPNFPNRRLEAGDERTIEFIQFLDTLRQMAQHKIRLPDGSRLEDVVMTVSKGNIYPFPTVCFTAYGESRWR